MLKDNWLERQLATVRELITEGSKAVRSNKLVGAEKQFREAEIILDSAENITDAVLELRSVVNNEMGVIATRTNDADKAIRYHKAAVDTLIELQKQSDKDITSRLAGSRLNLGGIYAAVGRVNEAEQENQAALELLAGRDDDGSRLMRIGCRQNLGTLLFSRGRKDEGFATFSAVEDDVNQLAEHGSDDVRFSLVQMLINSAVARLRVDAADQAVKPAELAASLAIALYEKAHNTNTLNQVLNSQMNLLNVHQQAGSFASAENALFRVLDTVPGHPEVIKRGQEFYTAILALDDAKLEAGGLPRDEAEESFEELNGMLAKA